MSKFFLITYGCKLNQADSEIMRTLLLNNKFKESSLAEADFVIINTCGVVEKTEIKIFKKAEELKKAGKKIILTGCLIAISPKECLKIADAVLGTSNLDSVVEAAKNILKNKKFQAIENQKIDKSLFLKKSQPDFKNVSAVVAIAEGCLGNCTYCASKLARKKLQSFSIENIINEIKTNLESGFKEIQLTSQDLIIYGLDQKKYLLPDLMEKIEKIENDFKVKLGMMNPGYAKMIFDDLLIKLESKKFYKFLHLPIQSGSNKVLKQMKRGYQAEDFVLLAKKFKKKFPQGVLATDIIIGHPSETEEDFAKTTMIIKKIKPDVLHIFKYSRRKNTEDFSLPDYPDRIKKERSRILTKIFKDYNFQKNKKFLKTKQNVLIIQKNQDGYLARNDFGRAIVLKNGKLGEKITVKIIGYKWNYLIGESLEKKKK
ncbi:MAG: tRNA (N(6)-L-threonylcarbamoyladenosine(37)-C(2))-methylthiotransferase [Candidatus Paceibacterota bacterium]